LQLPGIFGMSASGVQPFMRSQITTLFADPPPPYKSGPSSYAVSIVFHCVVMVWIYLGIKRAPQINDQSPIRRFTVRLLRQEITPQQQTRRTPDSDAARPARASATHDIASDAPPGGSPAPMSSPAPSLPDVINHAQTLIQPDVPPDVSLIQEVPVPAVVRWSVENDFTKAIVLPPKVLSKSDIKATLTLPNKVPVPADIKISATAFSTSMPTLDPGSPSPVVVRSAEPEKRIPESTTQTNTAAATPARIISLSDLRAKDENVTIPAANASPKSAPSDSLTVSSSSDKGAGGAGNPVSQQNGSGTGKNASPPAAKPDSGSSSVAQNGLEAGSPHGSPDGLGSGSPPSTTHITLAKDGQFGVVVVGSSLENQYPEIANVWGSRLIYTVYLHVGAKKNWILQYSLPRAADAVASGSNVRPDAPWPYDILRPNLAPEDSNSEAIMVHGFVNLSGGLERLAVVFPTDFTQAKFVLNALQQWKFRAARQSGQFVAVEVLLIIPQEPE
jgi:hypothetical protein